MVPQLLTKTAGSKTATISSTTIIVDATGAGSQTITFTPSATTTASAGNIFQASSNGITANLTIEWTAQPTPSATKFTFNPSSVQNTGTKTFTIPVQASSYLLLVVL